MRWVVTTSLVLWLTSAALARLDVLSFNVKKFGTTKISDQDTVDILIKIVEQYDISLIMEVVDISEMVIPNFVSQLNSAQQGGTVFNYSISERLGTTTYKEQYAFVYKTQTVDLLGTYQYPQSSGEFERPPYCILVQSINPDTGDLPQFFLVGIHTKPDHAEQELSLLDDVLSQASVVFGTQDAMVLGDFNADCTYISQATFSSLDLVVDKSATWWIDSDVDTTTGTTNCSYDRIVTSGDLTQYVISGSAGVVRFDLQFDLNTDQVSAVSDHYPVEIALQGAPLPSPSPTPDSSGCSRSANWPWSVALSAALLSLLVCPF